MYSYNKSNYYPYKYNKYANGDRFFGGGVLLPFILGGIAGSALARPQPYPYPYPYPQPYPVPYPVNYGYPTTTYSNTDYNYYY